MESASQRLREVNDRIDRAARLAGRTGESVSLIAVSKHQEPAAIQALIDAGHRDFGENRIQEAQAKWGGESGLRAACPDVRLHFVGRLQSNKAKDAVALFDEIHSVDRLSLVTALGVAMRDSGQRRDCFIQVNIGEEAQKGGCAIDALPGLLQEARDTGLPIAGLMAVPPADREPAPYFALLARLARLHDVAGLSIGMSGDYETAVMIGATHVRVGTALFGPRRVG